jgi:hypothetical protein
VDRQKRSATNNGLPSNNRFCFQGDLVKVNRIRESKQCLCIYSLLLPIVKNGLFVRVMEGENLLRCVMIQPVERVLDPA